MSFHDEEATVEYDPTQATLAELIAAVEGLGFQSWDTATEKRADPP